MPIYWSAWDVRKGVPYTMLSCTPVHQSAILEKRNQPPAMTSIAIQSHAIRVHMSKRRCLISRVFLGLDSSSSRADLRGGTAGFSLRIPLVCWVASFALTPSTSCTFSVCPPQLRGLCYFFLF